jgi:lipopolysaccharide export system protein LptA
MKHVLNKTLFLCALLLTSSAFAQTGNQEPIEITASKSVEWLRNQKQYVAREDVIVTQGNMQIFADLLTADYRDGATSSMEIWQITAEGNVRIKDDKNTAYGDQGVYDVTGGVAVLTGGDLKLVSPDQTVTAKDRMEYHSNERIAKAIGNAKVVRAKDTLNANTITAYFKDSAAAPAATQPSTNPVGGGSLDRLEADGNVVITTPTEVLRGSKAVYRADSNTAEITGKVKIERGENVMEGERAEVNLTTNVSKMFGSNKDGGRVRGVFFPGSEKGKNKGQEKPAPIPAPFEQAPPVPAPATAPQAAPPAPASSQSTNSSGAAAVPGAKVSPKLEY